MRIRVLGGGWYGCHLALALSRDHEVELYETADQLFAGASGAQPARLHLGFHYPRSKLTRAACQDHYARFMGAYGHLTRGVPVNIYAIAEHSSLVDFANYRQSLKEEVEFVTIAKPEEFGLRKVEGALLTGERHVVVREAREWFTDKLKGIVQFGVLSHQDGAGWKVDWTIDCTFCSRDNVGVDRYEPCVTALLSGPTSRAVTIMDGPFPSLYPWDEEKGLCSLTSALLTPLSKECRSREVADSMLADLGPDDVEDRCRKMLAHMAHFYPSIEDDYRLDGYKTAVRAMPLSGSDARLVDVVRMGERLLRVRAGKLDAVFYAEDVVREMMQCSR